MLCPCGGGTIIASVASLELAYKSVSNNFEEIRKKFQKLFTFNQSNSNNQQLENTIEASSFWEKTTHLYTIFLKSIKKYFEDFIKFIKQLVQLDWAKLYSKSAEIKENWNNIFHGTLSLFGWWYRDLFEIEWSVLFELLKKFFNTEKLEWKGDINQFWEQLSKEFSHGVKEFVQFTKELGEIANKLQSKQIQLNGKTKKFKLDKKNMYSIYKCSLWKNTWTGKIFLNWWRDCSDTLNLNFYDK